MRRVWRTPPVDVSALVVSSPANIKYLCGFDGSAGLVLTTPERTWLLVDGRYDRSARIARGAGQLANVEIATLTGSFERLLSSLIADLKPGAIGFEADHVTVASLRIWERACAERRFVATAKWIERLRIIKDQAELHAIRRACSVTSELSVDWSVWSSGDSPVTSTVSCRLPTARRPSTRIRSPLVSVTFAFCDWKPDSSIRTV